MRKLAILFLTFSQIAKAHAGALDTWTNVGSTTYGHYSQIIYADGTFVAICGQSAPPSVPQGGYSLSPDGIHWSNHGAEFVPTGITFGNGLFVISELGVGNYNDSGALESFNTNFTSGGLDHNISPVTGVTFAQGMFVATAYFYEAGQGDEYRSTDGTNWLTSSIANDFYPTGVAYDGGEFLAVGRLYSFPASNSEVYYSWDGTNWDDTGLSGQFKGISFVNGSVYASLANGTYYRDWAPFSGPVPNIWLRTSGTNSIYVSVSGTNVYTSTDATNWITHPTGLTNTLTGIAYGGDHFVVVSYDGSIFLSGSATPSLTVQNQSPSGVQLTITGGLGPTYRLQASTDLSTWTNVTTFSNFGVSTQFMDTNAGNFALRYFRTVSP